MEEPRDQRLPFETGTRLVVEALDTEGNEVLVAPESEEVVEEVAVRRLGIKLERENDLGIPERTLNVHDLGSSQCGVDSSSSLTMGVTGRVAGSWLPLLWIATGGSRVSIFSVLEGLGSTSKTSWDQWDSS